MVPGRLISKVTTKSDQTFFQFSLGMSKVVFLWMYTRLKNCYKIFNN